MSKSDGWLKFFLPHKEFGFLRSNTTDRDIFFHWKDVETNITKEELGKLDRIKASFIIHKVPNGFEAKEIELDLSSSTGDILRGIRAWEALDLDGNVVKFKMDEYEEVEVLNLSKNLKMEFKVAGDRVIARITTKNEDDIGFGQK